MNCFVIMPFSETKHSTEGALITISSDEWRHIYNRWIKMAVESFPDTEIRCKRSETIQGNFVKGIVQEIYNSEIAIVDLTGQKPNVYYELGIRHSLRLGTIITTQDFNALPSDLKSYYCFSYNYSDKSHLYDKYYKEFEFKLHEEIRSVINNITHSDNPVSDYLDLKHYDQEKDKQLRIVLRIAMQIEAHLYFVFSKVQTELENRELYIDKSQIFFNFIDLHYLDNSISQLFNLESDFFDNEKIDKLKNFYLNFRRDVYYIHQYWEGTRVNLGVHNIRILMDIMQNFFNRRDN